MKINSEAVVCAGMLALWCGCSGPTGRDAGAPPVTGANIDTITGAMSVSGATIEVIGPTTGDGASGSTTAETSGVTNEATTSEPGDSSASTSPHGSASTSESGEGPACAGVSVDAKPKLAPVDILVVVDNSGSMVDENKEVQMNLNAFADTLVASELDFRIFLISQYPGDNKKIGICVEPELGGGGCPNADSKDPYFHINRYVHSYDALTNIESTAAEWYPKMKPGAVKAVIAVTDDDAVAPVKGMPTPLAVAEAEAARFHEMLIENFPGFKGRYAFHAITGIAGQVCANIARVGTTYAYLAKEIPFERSAGILANLCNQDFEPIFASISQSIASGAVLPCALGLPAAPMGQNLDFDRVNVLLSLDGMPSIPLERVKDAFDCVAAQDGMGWYYDNAADPSKIHLCGAACLQGQEDGAKLALELGCESVVPG